MSEVIERKGIGHPDTVADNIGEELGKLLSEQYILQYGKVMHYNVDKVLVASGKIDYSKKEMVNPVNIVFAGQYTLLKEKNIDFLLDEAVDRVLQFNKQNGLKIKIYNMLAEGSPDLSDNFSKRKCNDTSFGVGNPYTEAEKLVLELGSFLDNLKEEHIWAGNDNKIMYINGAITIAFAFKNCEDSKVYFNAKEQLTKLIKEKYNLNVLINNADSENCFFNTLTGSSLEQGDAGMTGRGNRYNGLITPLRLMTLEAYYGKNNETHIGRIYQRMAQEKAEELNKSVLMVNNIGGNINEPITVVV